MRHTVATLAGLCALGFGALACGDDETTTPTTTATSTATGGSGGAGGTTTTTSNGGGGGTGGGGGMGPEVVCLDKSEHEMVFTIQEASLCLAAKYTAKVEVGTDQSFYTAAPTWGSHGGLVFAKPGATPSDVTITRLTAPEGATGELSVATSKLDLAKGKDIFLGSQALDLPGTKWTFVTYTTLDVSGEALAFEDKSLKQAYDHVGLFAAATVASGDKQRLLYTGSTAFGDGDPKNGKPGLYAADFCAGPKLCDQGAVAVDTWGVASGMIAADEAGNVFASQLTMQNEQELRAYGSDQVAPGGGALTGETLFVLPGFAGSMAASAPRVDDAGYLFVQPRDPNFVPSNVLVQRYQSQGAAVSGEGPATDAVIFVADGTEAMLATDDSGWLWMGVVSAMGGETTFYVLARRPD